MINKITILLVIFLCGSVASAQSLKDFLLHVATGNPEIVAYGKLLKAREYEAKTGNVPDDPFVSVSIMPGTNETNGRKTNWGVSQSFAFPSKYLTQKKINRGTVMLAEQEFRLGKLRILLEAEQTYLDLIHQTRYMNILAERKKGYDRLQVAWKKMLDNGETTIMDYNRIMVEITGIILEINKTGSEIEMLNERLAYLSGNSVSQVIVSDYPELSYQDPGILISEKKAFHPLWLIPELEYQISLGEIKLNKAGALPEFEVGYASESVPGETFTGPTGGISIPLWSNTNMVKTAKAHADHLSARNDGLYQKMESEIAASFMHLKSVQESISGLNKILEEGGGTKYLDSALDSGEISLTSYFNYLEALYDSEDMLLELENAYYRILADLTDHTLLNEE
jgi:outer membrane protein TolC